MGEGRWGLRQLGVFGHPRCLMLYYCWFSGLLGLCFLDMVTLHFFFPKVLLVVLMLAIFYCGVPFDMVALGQEFYCVVC